MIAVQESISYAILGAGPCGLGAAWKFHEEQNEDFLIFDQESSPGGLARSFVDEEGFTWDIGGHVQFSHYDDFARVMDEVLPNEWLHHQRESWVWICGRFVPYPFQNNIHRLPEVEQERCLHGLKNRLNDKAPQNFRDWIDQSFGEGLADLFLIPYNKKVWAFDPSEMDFQWIGERVAQVDLARIEDNIRFSRDDVSWGPNSTFRFPQKGGTGRIWREVAARIPSDRFRLGEKLVSLDLQKREMQFESGRAVSFERLLSTIPLHRLLHLAGLKSAREPLWSQSHIVGIGLKGQAPESLRSKCWMYFPEDNCPFYRVTVFSNYSPYNVPDATQHWSLMCETSESKVKPVDEAKIVEQTVQGLLNTQLISDRSQIVSQWHYVARPGYPTPFLGREKWVRPHQAQLSEWGVDSRGRFGNWYYEVSNQDHSFMQGFEWAAHQLGLFSERTAFEPSWANAPGKRESLPRGV